MSFKTPEAPPLAGCRGRGDGERDEPLKGLRVCAHRGDTACGWRLAEDHSSTHSFTLSSLTRGAQTGPLPAPSQDSLRAGGPDQGQAMLAGCWVPTLGRSATPHSPTGGPTHSATWPVPKGGGNKPVEAPPASSSTPLPCTASSSRQTSLMSFPACEMAYLLGLLPQAESQA